MVIGGTIGHDATGDRRRTARHHIIGTLQRDGRVAPAAIRHGPGGHGNIHVLAGQHGGARERHLHARRAGDVGTADPPRHAVDRRRQAGGGRHRQRGSRIAKGHRDNIRRRIRHGAGGRDRRPDRAGILAGPPVHPAPAPDAVMGAVQPP